ncbi:MAG: toll/interleukin-1 receptor domain-containing protein [Deltaproteobacteria bacterium]|nr:MAG: toll/interleukin-1 receptor domain-containing protein [Deltaproteobacteria bacterium]
MGALVFISHSSQDHGVAVSVCEALERRGVGCWLASRDISPGDNFQEAIVTAISSVRAMVLVFTGSANNSDEIKKEIALASHSMDRRVRRLGCGHVPPRRPDRRDGPRIGCGARGARLADGSRRGPQPLGQMGHQPTDQSLRPQYHLDAAFRARAIR